MAGFKAVAFVYVATAMVTLSGALAQVAAPAPSPDAGAGYSLPVSAAIVASSLGLSMLALIKN